MDCEGRRIRDATNRGRKPEESRGLPGLATVEQRSRQAFDALGEPGRVTDLKADAGAFVEERRGLLQIASLASDARQMGLSERHSLPITQPSHQAEALFVQVPGAFTFT